MTTETLTCKGTVPNHPDIQSRRTQKFIDQHQKHPNYRGPDKRQKPRKSR